MEWFCYEKYPRQCGNQNNEFLLRQNASKYTFKHWIQKQEEENVVRIWIHSTQKSNRGFHNVFPFYLVGLLFPVCPNKFELKWNLLASTSRSSTQVLFTSLCISCAYCYHIVHIFLLHCSSIQFVCHAIVSRSRLKQISSLCIKTTPVWILLLFVYAFDAMLCAIGGLTDRYGRRHGQRKIASHHSFHFVQFHAL